MHVVATAGHVDHGKSTLVRALTGMEPDRWAEERRRGMTIDLGYAWMALPGGAMLAFVDVPGHERFIGNMLAGLGPAPAVMFVVAADEGWRPQSTEHLAAVDALGLRDGLLVVTRSDLADPRPATEEALDRLGRSSLGAVEAVAVSGATGSGIPVLRDALQRLANRLPTPDPTARVRLWVDRSFTVRGSGTVVTGTLPAGTLTVGDELELDGRRLRVRGLQSLGEPQGRVEAVARVAVNLRSVAREDVGRGHALLTPDSWRQTDVLDARLPGSDPAALPSQLVLHLGTASVPVRLRALGGETVRLSLARPLPLVAGDRAILRDPGRHAVAAGVVVLDVDPPTLRRRGAARERALELGDSAAGPDLAAEVRRRGAVPESDLTGLGLGLGATVGRESLPPGVHRRGTWLVDDDAWLAWGQRLGAFVDQWARAHPLDPAVPTEVARREVAIPDVALVPDLAEAAGVQLGGGRLTRPGVVPSLGPAEPGLQELERRLRTDPFAAPERPDLDELGLGPRQLAAAERAGRLLRLSEDVVLLPDAPARAMRALAALQQPFTLSEARVALGTTRRVAVPLLEHCDSRGWTVRVDPSHRRVRR
ncbi:MAG TPA: selenocysteine-specific translation elongation factor [Oryzihumus sp.]|nr:selenocysteine-specific translation elongation factor [Oryzihumus sp.]